MPRLPPASTRLALVAAALAAKWWLDHQARSRVRASTAIDTAEAMPTVLPTGTHPSKVHAYWALLLAGFILGAAALAGATWTISNTQRITREAGLATGGDPQRAIPIMLDNGCAGCHTITGVPGAQGLVGPRLDSTLAARTYIGGDLPNTAANLIRWLRFSRKLNPHTAMPSTLISEQDARDVAAYLYALH